MSPTVDLINSFDENADNVTESDHCAAEDASQAIAISPHGKILAFADSVRQIVSCCNWLIK